MARAGRRVAETAPPSDRSPAPAADGARRRTLAEDAYDVIKDRIIRLDLPPGHAFSESELAASLGHSKTPVREALARLLREGLVEVMPRSGYRVAPITVADAQDLLRLRTLLETEAAGLAAARDVDADELHRLEALCRTSYDPDDHASISRFLQANTRFHSAVAHLSGNNRLAAVLTQVLEQLERLFHLGLTLRPRSAEIVHEHQELLDALQRRDPESARRAADIQGRAAETMVLDALLSSEAVLRANVNR